MSPRFALLLARYGLGLASIALAVVLRLELDWTLGASAPMLFLFVVPVGIAAWYGGFGPGAVTTLLGGAADALLFTPTDDGGLASSIAPLRLGLYATTGLTISYLGAELRTARRRAPARLRALREVEARYPSAREEEASRIAREIHDELGAALTGLRWDLEWLEAQLDRAEPPTAPGLREKVARLVRLADSTILTVRRISSDLRPAVLDDLGLVEALEWQTDQLRERSGMGVVFRADVAHARLPRAVEAALFRIYQEAVTNILRHSRATRVEITLVERDGDLILEVYDDGRGIEPGVRTGAGSLGLLGMQERAGQLGGGVTIETPVPGGTRVTARVPLPQGEPVGAA